MALMLRVGGLAGNLVTSAVVSTDVSRATVDADGKRLYKNVAKKLGRLVSQGWVPPGAVN
jgi:hypothetical protein